jgi:hypothetical protein
MKLQDEASEAGRIPIDSIAHDGPAHGGAMHAQLVSAAGQGREGHPGDAVFYGWLRASRRNHLRVGRRRRRRRHHRAAPQHFPGGRRWQPFRIRFHPPAASGIEASERQLDRSLVSLRDALNHRPIRLADLAVLEQKPQMSKRLAVPSQHQAS